MDDDWDAEDFVPPPPAVSREQPKSQWDDEDKEEEPVRESWEDEEKPKPPPPPPKPKDEKKDKDKSKKLPAEKKEAVSVEQKQQQQPSDLLADKLRQQRLVEESDYQMTSELFGKDKDGKSLESFIPKSEADFLEYAELIAQKITPFQKSFHYMVLLKAVIKNSVASLKAADAKDLASAVTVIANEKLKAEKEATAGKKKGGVKKKQLNVDKMEEDSYSQVYDDAEDFDFM